MPITPITSKTNAQAVIDQVVALIERGEWKSGGRLPSERELAALFAVSRTCVREAFSALTLLGVLEVRPGEGAFVSALHVAPLMNTLAPLLLVGDGAEADLLAFRRMIETEGVRLLAARRDPAALTAMGEAVAAMERALALGDAAAGARADLDFHMAMLSGAGNRVLSLAAECTASLMSRSVNVNREKLLADPTAAERLLKQHRALLAAVERGRAGEAAALAGSHLDQVLQSLEAERTES